MLSGMFQVPLWVKAEAAGEFFRIHGFWALILEGFHTGAFLAALNCFDLLISLVALIQETALLDKWKGP